MRKYLNLFFILWFLVSFGQSEIGIGIVSINFDENTKIEFYENIDLKKKLKTVEFFNDESINSWNIKNLENHKNWLQPESMWLDYGLFKFRCKTKKKDRYEVYVSGSQTMWIKVKNYTDYFSWEDYLKNMFSIERSDKKTQFIYSRPFTKSAKIKSENDCFEVKQMQNEWIKVETAGHCESEKRISGWIKWRDGNRILINYYPTS